MMGLGSRGFLALAVAFLGGCAVFSDKPKPAELESLAAAPPAPVWSASGGRVEFPMQMGVAGERVASAASDGTITVRGVGSAAPLWTARVNARLSAGVGFDGQRAAVVTQGNELVVLANGAEVWRKRLASGVTTPPLVAGERVFILGLDRAVEAYDAADGRYLWRLQRTSDPLALQLPGVLMPLQDTLLVGQGARLVGVDPTRGAVRWDLPLATPRGSNEVERLSDLVGPAVRMGDVVCARAFQLAVSCADVGRNTLRWTRNTGGVHPIAATAEAVAAADASDRMTAWRAGTGELLWSHERFLHRGLSGVAVWGGRFVVGDDQGMVHVLDAQTGKTLMRLSTDGSDIVSVPRVVGKTLLVATRRGGVYAWATP